jgi:autotransporter-associated beta strand protein
VNLTGANTFTGGIQFWGGILQVAGISSLGSGGLTFNGGTFQWTATGPDISSRGVTLNSGGATFDANGYTVSLASAIGGSGGLTVASTTAGGTLNLNAAETYTGATTINNGATLGGSGSLGGSVTALSGGTFALTGSVAGSLTLNSGALATLTASATTPQSVGGAATFNGNTTTVIVPGTLVDGISYPILTAAGGVSGTLANVSYSGGLPSQVYSLSYNATQVLLVVAQGQLSATWNGSSGGNWSTGPWADTGGGSVVPNGTGDSAIFGTGGSPVNLNENVTLGTILFDGSISYAINGSDTLTVNDNGHGANITVTAGANSIQPPIILAESTKTVVGSGESLALAGAISGAGYTLTLTGAGTNILNGANSYGPAANTVGTTLSGGGTLQLGNSSALSTGDLSVSASTIQAGAPLTLPNNIDLASGTTYFELNGYNVTLDGTINYNGNLFVEDAGTLTLAGVNTGTGTTTIEGPGVTVSIAADSALGAAPSSLVIDNADLKVTGSPVTLSATRAIAIGSALETSSTASIDAFGASLNVGGAISGSAATANLTVNGNGGSGTVALQGAGTFNGTAMVSAGTLDVANTGALQNSTVLYNTGGGAIEFDGSITAVTFGALSGTQNLSLANTTNGAVTLTVGGNNSSTTYSGNLTDGGVGGAFAFNGTGTMTLTGTSSYKGTTAVDQGILLLTNGGSISCGPTTVSAGAELEITGGALTATGTSELYDTAGSGSTLLIANGSATFASLEGQSANTGGVLIQVNTGGILTASNLFYGRSGYNSGATLPTTGQTNSGLYVDGGTVNVTSNYTMSANSADQSSVTAEIDAGSVTVAGILTIGLNNTGRWSVMDVNGGTLTVNDTNIGISLGATNAGLAALLVRNGMVTANIITMGGPAANAYTAGATAEIYQTNGTLYLGSGGIVQPQTVNVASIIQLGSGTLGATANWSCSIPGQTITLGVNGGDTYTIQAADASNVPHNISLLNQTLTGVGNLVKTGGGTLALNGDTNTWTGTTTVSAGTLALTGDGTNSGVLLDTTPTINIIAPGVLDVTGLLDQTLHLSDPYVGQGSAQALTGNGTVTGSVIVENGGYGGTGAAASLAPAGATPNSFGNFTITGNLTNTSAIILKVDHPPTGAINDEVTALTMTNFADLAESSVVPTLTIVNTNYDLQTGDTFKLFNITGGNYAHIGNNLTITLPTTSPVTSTSYTWDTTQLAVNGTIKLTHGVAPTIPITPTNIVFGLTGRTLTISWPASYKGWSLQSNSINIAVPADWYTVPGSPAVTSENITIPTTGSVYFRLYYQAP